MVTEGLFKAELPQNGVPVELTAHTILLLYNMFENIEPPTEKIFILCQILKVLLFLTLLQVIFLAFNHEVKALLYLLSIIFYLGTIIKISYFGCILNQIFNLAQIWFLLLEVGVGRCRWRSS